MTMQSLLLKYHAKRAARRIKEETGIPFEESLARLTGEPDWQQIEYKRLQEVVALRHEKFLEEAKLYKEKLSYLTAEDAKQYGFQLDPGWAVKTAWDEADLPKYTYVDPEGWEYTDLVYDDKGDEKDYIAISPEGKRYTKAEIVALQATPFEEPQYATQKQFDLLKKYKEQGTLAEKEAIPDLWLTGRQAEELGYKVEPGEDFLLQTGEARARHLYGEIVPPAVPSLLQRIYPEKFEKSPETAVQDIITSVQQDTEGFIADLRQRGRNPDTEDLLTTLLQGSVHTDTGQPFTLQEIDELVEDVFEGARQVTIPRAPELEMRAKLKRGGIPETEIDKLIEQSKLDLSSEEWLTKWKSINPSAKKDITHSLFMRSTAKGLGGILEGGAGAAAWQKQEQLSKNMSEVAKTLLSYGVPTETWKPELSTVLDPRFWQTTVAEALPFTVAAIGGSIVGYMAGAAILGAAGLGATWTYVITSLGMTAVSAVGESAIEAGGAYNEAIAKGMTEEEAVQVANSVFGKEVAGLTGSNAVQFFTAFMPSPFRTVTSLVAKGLITTARVGGKMVITGLTEGGEEVWQDMVRKQALGETFEWNDEEKMVAMVGAIMGVGFGVSGDVFTTLQSRIVDRLPAEVKTKVDARVEELKAQGVPDGQAKFTALNELPANEEVAKVIDEVVKEVKQEEAIKEVVPENKIEAAAWEHMKDKVVKAKPATEGETIAQELGVKFDGVQEGIGMQFTDPQTGSTTYGDTLEEVKTKLTAMRAKFAEAPTTPTVEGVTPTPMKEGILAAKEVTRARTVRLTPEAEVQTSYQILKDKFITEGVDPNVIDIALETYGFKPKIDRTGAVLTREGLQFKLQDDVGVEETIRKLTREILGKKFGVPANEVDMVLEGGSRVNPTLDIAEANAQAEKIANLIRSGLPTRKELLSRYLPEPALPTETGMPEVTRARPPARHEVPEFGEEGAIPPPTPPDVAKAGRRYVIEERLRRGEPVSDKLLAEFPDLQTKVVGGFVAPTAKGSVEQGIEAGIKQAQKTGQNVYVFPTAEGMKLGKQPPPFRLQHYIAKPDGTYEFIPFKEAGMPEAVKPPEEVAPEVPAAPVEEVAPPEIPPTPPVEGVVAPPMPEGAAKRVFDRIQIEPAEEGFTEKVRQGYHKFQVKMIDDLYSIKKFTEAYTKGGVELSIEENPYLLARLLRGISGKANVFIEQGTFGKTFWKVEKGKAVPNFTGESLENILKEVREPGAWQDFSTYLVARRSVELSARDIETGVELADAQNAIQELEAKHKNFPDLAKRVYKYQDNLLVYGQEMGLLSEDLLGKLRKYGNYVPFYRVFNELQAKGFMGKKMADIASPIKRIKGSEREIINPLESIIKNTYVMISAADRNQVGIMMANLVDKNPELAEMFERVKTPMARVAGVTAKELGVEIEGLSAEDAEAVVDIFRPSFFVRGDEVTVLIDGKKAYFKVDPDLRDGLLNLDRETMGIIGKFLSYPAKWLRAGATLSPDFMVRNPARDALTAFVFSEYNFLPGVDFMRGIASVIRKDADYQLFRASGAEHSMMVSMDREYLHKTFNEVVQGKKFTDYVKHPLELFQIVSELGEKATRLGEFKAGIRRGATPLEAGYSARVVTLDFAQAGTTAHAINRFAAFFNANIRGNTRIISSFKEHPVRTSLKIFVGITLLSILLYYANRDDERWKEIPQWQKDIFWIVFLKPLPENWKGMTAKEKSAYINNLNQFESGIYRIPKPFGLGQIFGSVPERFLEWLDNKNPDMMKNVLQTIVESGTPNPLPTAVMPIIEWMSNYSFFRGQAIVPASREKMPPELQYTAWTSEVSKKLGELLKLPPAKIDNLINGWTGGLGRYATGILDGILKKTGISPDIPEPSPELADIPVIKAFVVRSPYGSSGEAVESFYDVLEKYEQGEKYLQEMLKLGEKEKFEKYKASHPELIFLFELSDDPKKEDIHYSASARYLRRVARDLSELGKKQDLIYKAKDISSDEKRRLIDEIDFLKTELTRKALDLLIGKEPQLLQDSLNESIGRLGEVIEETPVLSLEKPDIFDMGKLHTDFGNKLEAATKEDLAKLTGVDPLAFAFLEVKGIEKTIDPIVNKKIYEVKPDLKEGVTFEDYYKAWQSGIVKDEVLSNLTRRQVELLRKYHGLDKAGQKQFLKDNPELDLNPRQEWLKTHPKENAQLAVWGQAKILTKEAYNQFKGMVKALDIPDSAIPPLTLPPETSMDTHFAYEDMVSEGKHGSWEAKLLLKQDAQKAKESGVKSYADWAELTLSDTPIASLELKTEPKFREIYDKIKDFSDKESADYKDDKVIVKDRKTAREIAVAEAYATKIGNLTYRDVERKIEAIEKGTDAKPVDDKLVNAHVEFMKMQDAPGVGSSSASVMLYRVDDPNYNKWRMDDKVWGDNALKPVDETRIPIWRIDVKYATQDTAYKAIEDKYPKAPVEQKRELAAFLAKPENKAYATARLQRGGYELGLTDVKDETGTSNISKWVEFNQLPEYGDWRNRYRVSNRNWEQAVNKALTGKGKDPWTIVTDADVRNAAYDTIYETYKPLFKTYETAGDKYSQMSVGQLNTLRPSGVSLIAWNEKTPSQKREVLAGADRQKLFDANHAFFVGYYKREAYDLRLTNIDDFVGYKDIIRKGKPEGQDQWFDEDWYLMEHPKFYKEMTDLYVKTDGKQGWKPDDFKFDKVPTRQVFALYLNYKRLPEGGVAREIYRKNHLDLDAWLVKKFGFTSITASKQRTSTVAEEIARIQMEVKGKLAGIGKK